MFQGWIWRAEKWRGLAILIVESKHVVGSHSAPNLRCIVVKNFGHVIAQCNVSLMLRHLGRVEERPRERKRHEDTGREMKDSGQQFHDGRLERGLRPGEWRGMSQMMGIAPSNLRLETR